MAMLLLAATLLAFVGKGWADASSSFVFNPPQNTTVCQNTTFTWTYTGTENQAMTFTITNAYTMPIVVDDDTIGLVSLTLDNNIAANAGSVTWLDVGILPGQYQIVAFSTEFMNENETIDVRSAPFWILPGDLSCLQPKLPLSLLPLGASPTAVAGDSSTASVAGSHGLRPGAIAGIVVGCVVGVLLVVSALTYRYRYQVKKSRHNSTSILALKEAGPYVKF